MLIAKYGHDEKLFTWKDEITVDCPRKQARNDSDPCRATNSETACPKLPAKRTYGGHRGIDANDPGCVKTP
jgi:hypothetical protein